METIRKYLDMFTKICSLTLIFRKLLALYKKLSLIKLILQWFGVMEERALHYVVIYWPFLQVETPGYNQKVKILKTLNFR